MDSAARTPRGIRVFFQGEWAGPGTQGLLASDPRIRTLRRVLVSYPEVRHILPDRISLDSTAEAKTLESVTRFLERQQWLVKSVILE